MKLILTHEHADFDAIASQLAAHKLDPAARPVLPRKLNQNVRDFYTLYRGALPHITQDELRQSQERRRVEHVTVVDTQSPSSVRGMRPDTPLHIIDHHPPPEDLPPHATFSGEQLGAATTFLVEQLQKADIALSSIEATLLMLGIYEDTGSLLYGTTTPRDIAAAAWLMTQGADLDVVRRFLQHPLNDEQSALFDLLAANLTIREIAGQAIVIATAKIDHQVEEISTVAHKLRNLVEASALFVLVQMRARVRLVARSAVDEVNAGEIAQALGGGGHSRAAAALVEGSTLEAVQERLEALLEAQVRPPITVADLMSRGVQTVPASRSIAHAAEDMQREGHEGYPVVEDGQLVGLLTRRAVDRAMHHGMGSHPIAEVMESGRITVRLDDSVRRLQTLMTDSGWGQIPVADDEGKLIGIVTRTDLIKHWGQPGNGAARRAEIAARLEESLSPGLWALVKAISAEAQTLGLGLYLVGGLVRDLLLGRRNNDVDLVVEGGAIELARAMQGRYGGTLHQHDQFRTATWFLNEAVLAQFPPGDDWPPFVDFATARTEFYESPTVLPTVVPRGSIKSDLHRRDFSINALAVRLSPEPFGQLLDFWGGERDLQAGLVRVLHSLSFIDDPTRILRAARFEQRFNFHIEERTLRLIERAAPLVNRLSGPRIRHEIEYILGEERLERALRRLDTLGVWRELSPQLCADGWLDAAIEALRYARRTILWPELAALSDDREEWMLAAFVIFTCRLDSAEAERLGRRLQVRRQTLNEMQDGVALYRRVILALGEALPPSAVVGLLDGFSEIGLVVGWSIAPSFTARQHIVRYARQWRHIKHTLSPQDVRALGITPGPAYGALLRRLRAARLDGLVTTQAEETALAERLIARGDLLTDGPGD